MSLGSQFGLLPTGFFPKAVDDIQADLEAAFREEFGASINVTPQSRYGQIIGILTERYAELWALALTLYASFSPDTASGISLANLASLTGTTPLTPTPSTATIAAVGTPATVLTAGRLVATSGTGSIFQTTTSGTITAVAAYAGSHSYLLADRITSGSKVWQCAHPGTSSTPPTGTKGSTFTDGALTWVCLGAGTGAIDVLAQSEDTGNIVAASGALTVIQTPVAGWSDAYNVSPAVPGVAVELDPDLRIRRVQELHGQGLAAVEAVRAAGLAVPGVTSCTVFENTTDAVNGDGMPPHSVEMLVLGGSSADIAAAAFKSAAAGIATAGNQAPVTVTDSQGITHSVLYSRPTIETVWITFNLLVDPSIYPADGNARAVANLLAYGNSLTPDYDIFGTQLAAALLAGVPAAGLAGIPGILDTGLPLIGLSNPPIATTTIPISSRQLAQFDAGRIVINTSNGSP